MTRVEDVSVTRKALQIKGRPARLNCVFLTYEKHPKGVTNRKHPVRLHNVFLAF